MVEIDERLVLHLAVAAIAGAILCLVLLAQLYLVEGAVFADGVATLGTVVVLLAQQSELFQRSELSLAEGAF